MKDSQDQVLHIIWAGLPYVWSNIENLIDMFCSILKNMEIHKSHFTNVFTETLYCVTKETMVKYYNGKQTGFEMSVGDKLEDLIASGKI